MKKYKAPDFATAIEIEKYGFKDYKEYQEALKLGISNVDDYIAMKDGGFPDYMTFLQAKSENIYDYDQYSLKLDRVDRMLQLISRADSMTQEDFMSYMKFDDKASFLEWMTQIPKDSPIKIDGNMIVFNKDATESNTGLSDSIDEMLSSYSKPSVKEVPVTPEVVAKVKDYLQKMPAGLSISLDELDEKVNLSKNSLKKVIPQILNADPDVGVFDEPSERFFRS